MKRRRNPSRRQSPEDDEQAIDIIPLMDVMFLLLCFFIFLTMAMVVQEGISVDLAQATSGASVADKKEPLVVSVKANGTFFLNKQEISKENLLTKLQSRARENPDRPVYLNADQEAQHRHVITALDAIRSSELSNLTFTIKPGD